MIISFQFFLETFRNRLRDKTADFWVGQNSRPSERDKITDSDKETSPPISK